DASAGAAATRQFLSLPKSAAAAAAGPSRQEVASSTLPDSFPLPGEPRTAEPLVVSSKPQRPIDASSSSESSDVLPLATRVKRRRAEGGGIASGGSAAAASGARDGLEGGGIASSGVSVGESPVQAVSAEGGVAAAAEGAGFSWPHDAQPPFGASQEALGMTPVPPPVTHSQQEPMSSQQAALEREAVVSQANARRQQETAAAAHVPPAQEAGDRDADGDAIPASQPRREDGPAASFDEQAFEKRLQEAAQ
ncbi:unnamed protein product, partial [Prorocentrum cordatum]